MTCNRCGKTMSETQGTDKIYYNCSYCGNHVEVNKPKRGFNGSKKIRRIRL
jgi:hypothetical protein